MSRRRTCALVVLLAALVGCSGASDHVEGVGGTSAAFAGSAGKDGANGPDAVGAGTAGGSAGQSAHGGDGSGGADAAPSGGDAPASAGYTSAGATSAGTGGALGNGGSAGSATLGGNGGRSGGTGTGGSGQVAGAAGSSNGPVSSCADPLTTVDVSRLVASEAFDPYSVTGDTATQIRRSINQNRGMDYDAYTGWDVSWKFADCAGNGLVVTVNVKYQFPKWERSANASDMLAESWATYTSALFCHEYGHAKDGLDCANEVATALAAIHAGGDCGKQKSDGDAAFNTILAKYQQLDVQYDADTNHGATMGATFPPP